MNPEKLEIKTSVNYCYHPESKAYSLMIAIDNASVFARSAFYTHCPGNVSLIDITTMKPSDMLELAEQISNVANEIIEGKG